MLDLGSSKGFLSSLSRISLLNFQVWDAAEGLVFSSGIGSALEPPSQELRDFSTQIINQAAFRWARLKGKDLLFGIPIKNGEAVIGSLIAYSSNSRNPPQAETAMGARTHVVNDMEEFITQVAGLVEDKMATNQEVEEMVEELSQNFEELTLYAKVANRLKTITFSGSMLKELIEDLLETMRSDLAFAKLPNRPEYNTLASTEKISDKVSDPSIFVDRLIDSIPLNAPSMEDNYFIVNDSKLTPGYEAQARGPYRFLAVKMQHNDKFFGWMGLVSFNFEEIYRRSELRLLNSMAEQIAVVITNSDLYRDLERFVINMVKSLVCAIEAKDVYTRGHSERVCRYSLLMAERLDLDDEQKKVLQWSSILHDSGKIGIPESILRKPAKLNENEYQEIKMHPMKGHTILEPLEQLADSLPGMLHHHERYDGTGYPKGLKGKDIPLHARIIAVADTFDAMTSDRAYRPAKSPREVLRILEEVAGSQLDPDLVEVFKEVFTKDLAFDQE